MSRSTASGGHSVPSYTFIRRLSGSIMTERRVWPISLLATPQNDTNDWPASMEISFKLPIGVPTIYRIPDKINLTFFLMCHI